MNVPLTLDRLAINQATTRPHWTLEEAITGYAAAGIHGIAPWRDKLAACGTAHAATLLRDHGMHVTGLCRGGMFPYQDEDERQRHLDDNRRAIDDAAAIGAASLVLVCGGLPDGSKDLAGARSMILDMIGTLLPHARAAGVPLAIEPLHPMYAADRACINTMAQANDLCDALGPGVGIAVDVYHVWWDPTLETEIRRAGPDRLLGFHLCDWRVPTRDLLLDRAMMGDGVIDIARIRGWMDRAGYRGMMEVEIFSTDLWRRPAPDLLSLCKERFLTAC